MKKAMAVALLVVAVASIAKADLFSDRAKVYAERERITAEREQQRKANERLARTLDRAADFERLLRGFVQSRGGLATDGVCTMWVPDLSRDYLIGIRDTIQVPLSQVRGQVAGFTSCNVNLNDGLACTVSWARDTKADVLDARCFDANSNYKSFQYPSVAAKKSVPKKNRAQ